MASPVEAASATTSISSTADPWTVNLPTLGVVGHLFLMLVRAGGAQGCNGATGWTLLVDDNTSDASDDNTSILYRWTDGTEGTTVSVDFTAACKGAAIVWDITGAANPADVAIAISTVAVGTAANADSTNVAPGLGSQDFLFVVLVGMDGETQFFTSPTSPGAYSTAVIANSGTAGLPATNVRIAGATRQATASSEDPGAWTSNAPQTGWTAYTLAISPIVWKPKAGDVQRVRTKFVYNRKNC
jgi:hypothetical protein